MKEDSTRASTEIKDERSEEDKQAHFEARRANNKNLPKPITIEYCQTCSYKGRVNEITAELNQAYNNVRVIEEEYPIPQPWPLVAQILNFTRIAGLILLFAGDHVFAYMQMNYPPWYLYMKNNKFQVGILLFFGINMISNWVVSTGAFEVIYDGTLVYSGLKERRLPSVREILILLKEVIN